MDNSVHDVIRFGRLNYATYQVCVRHFKASTGKKTLNFGTILSGLRDY